MFVIPTYYKVMFLFSLFEQRTKLILQAYFTSLTGSFLLSAFLSCLFNSLLPTTHVKAMGSLVGWVLPFSKSLLMREVDEGHGKTLTEDFVTHILMSLAQSFLDMKSSTSSNYKHFYFPVLRTPTQTSLTA